MLPKVATHLLHTTTRSAAAAVHGQTSTLRNVLQSGASGPSSAGASNKQKSKAAAAGSSTSSTVKPVTIALVTASGSHLTTGSTNGAQQQSRQGSSSEDSNSGAHGQGRSNSGSKGNNKAGRRFYTNYNSASRAVTQANAIIVTEDVPGFQSSVTDDGPALSASFSSSTQERRALLTASATKPSGQRRTRLRSSSVNSLLPRNEKDKDGASMGVLEKISVLKTVQAQARSFHVLSAAASKAASPSKDQPSSSANEVHVQVEVAAPPPAVDLAASIPRAPSPAAAAPTPLRVASPLPRPRSPIQRRNSTSSIRSSSPLSFVEEPTEVQVHLAQVRRNSTVAAAAAEHESKDAKQAPQPPLAAAAEPASPSMSDVSASPSETSETPSSTSTRATSDHERAPKSSTSKTTTKYGQRVYNAQIRKDPAAVAEAVRELLDVCAEAERKEKTGIPPHVPLTTSDFNNSLAALLATRTEGQSIEPILDVYRAMLAMGDRQAKFSGWDGELVAIKPSFKTYTLLIDAFTTRDWEIHRMLLALNAQSKSRQLKKSAGIWAPNQAKEGRSPDERKIKALEEESKANMANALKLFEAMMEVGGRENLDSMTFKTLLKSCATHGNIHAALRVFGQWERRAGTVKTYQGKQFWQLGKSAKVMPSSAPGPDSEAYRYLILAFTNADDYEGAALVFKGFQQKWEEGKVHIKGTKFKVERGQIQVWNQMLETYFRKGEPEAAIDLLDTMLKASAERKGQSVPEVQEDVEVIPPVIPAPATSTFTTMIGGFIKMGDVPTAYKWFKRLLQETESPNQDPFVGALDGHVMKPDQVAWSLMLDALATNKQTDDLNDVFTRLITGPSDSVDAPTSDEYLARDGVRVLRSYRHLVYLANMEWLKEATVTTHEEMEQVLQRLNFIRDAVLPVNPTSAFFETSPSLRAWDFDVNRMVDGLSKMYLKFGAVGPAYHLVAPYVNAWATCLEVPANRASPEGCLALADLQNLVIGFWESTLDGLRQPDAVKELSWNAASGLAMLNMRLGLKVTPEQAAWLLQAYGQVAVHGDGLDVPADLYSILLGCAVHVDSAPNAELLSQAGIENFAFQGTGSLLQDIAARGFRFDNTLTDPQTRFEAVEVATRGHDLAWGRNFFGQLGETYLVAFEQHAQRHYAAVQEQLEDAAPREERIDRSVTPQPLYHSVLLQNGALTKEVDAALKDMSASQEERTERAFALFHSTLTEKGHTPHLPSLGRLIQACGRLGQLDRVQEVYHVSQNLIANLRSEMGNSKRRELWVMVEDSMIIALAHAGDVHGAHVHRRRILEYGGINEIAPGTQAANSMLAIPSADAYGALVLNVTDTTDDASNALMLWNEAMSLSRARKADSALELFHMMKDHGVVPSSITYGAVIGACARVGDVVSAETLFKEMTQQNNFKPRVPPYNTMMQVYTSTKPNRERALHYYNEMLSMGVQPTAHTYKLLLDLYGSVEPLDIAAMESTWTQLKSNRRVQIQGTHFASLINAYGCVLKDVDRAISIFHSIPSYIVSGKPLTPDAVAYEALMNALVANKRTDRIPDFIDRMAKDKVHMTAYVANFLIKGYANVGDVERARAIFESMMDPPTGVAAPNNHAPHDPSGMPEAVGVLDPVYREPSTWEAMIRAELGAGNRDHAYQLLERLKVRQYPEAVFNRISGVMVDHSAVVL
ncbi:pentatricopeptide repeat protein [Coprinopsis sp. MPI-PUGE-AT-0042]|nr:pentatricopeptide repeat protein [Coprinopsis sp. MPI-PUGE-AT-0042]